MLNLHRKPAGRWGGDHESASSLGRPLATNPARSEQANSRRSRELCCSTLKTSSQPKRKKSVLISPASLILHAQVVTISLPKAFKPHNVITDVFFLFVFCFLFFLVTNIATFEYKIAWRQREVLILFSEYIFLSFAAPKA